MKLTDLLNSLATKCGKQNDSAIIDILSRADLQNIDLVDAVANAINGDLLTIEGAKNNMKVKSHFNAQALGAVDAEILNSIKKLELGEEFESELSGQANTYEKQRKLTEKIKDIIDNLKASAGKGDDKAVEKYVKQINDLNAEISQMKESTVPKKELETVKKESEDELRKFMVHSKISGLKFANQNVSLDDNISFADVILNNRLSKAKAIVVKDGNELKLRQAEDVNLAYMDEQNKQVSFDDFMNKAFADAKILAVSGPPNPNNPVTPPVFNPNQQPVNQQVNMTEFNAAIQDSLL